MDKDAFPAHIRFEGDSKIVQTVEEHNLNVANYARRNLRDVGLASTAYLAGLLHDAGKYTNEFRKYIEDATSGKPVIRGSVNHTFAGVRYIFQEMEAPQDALNMLTKDILAYAIGAHHGQFDCIDENGKNGFDYRCKKDDPVVEEGLQNFKRLCNPQEIQNFYQQSVQEVSTWLFRIANMIGTEKSDKNWKTLNYYLGCMARLVQSSVIDGDRRDTAEFMNDFQMTEWKDVRRIWKSELQFAEDKMAAFDQSSEINKARTKISNLCREAAEKESGLFVLNVPTGAGKTISSLRFALAHALKNNKKRIIFTSPLLSILEQNAKVIRSFINDQKLILEHHSNAVNPQPVGDELNRNELLVETWDAPIIITSLVQLLNTFFEGKTSCIRRFQSLCNSIIVIDEVQTVPTNLLAMFNLMISFLVECCNTTVVLCSATQPAWDLADYPIDIPKENMVPYDQTIWNVFKRTEIIDDGNCKLEELPQLVKQHVSEVKSLLVVCNKKSESEFLYQSLFEEYECYHISASMCMEHRRRVLDKMRRRLVDQNQEPIICISTQVIEAGVDISFERVVRLLAGMDSVVQVAGRCNRNGESKALGEVHTIFCTDENLNKLKEIQQEKNAASKFFYEYHEDTAKFDEDPSSEKSIHSYYQKLYHDMKEGYQEDKLDGTPYTEFSLLSIGIEQTKNHRLNQAFKLAGQNFKVFDDSTVDVVVPFGEGKDIISDLCSERAKWDIHFVKDCLKKARNYTVTVYPWQLDQLERDHAICKIEKLDTHYLSDGYYSELTGLTLNPKADTFLEV